MRERRERSFLLFVVPSDLSLSKNQRNIKTGTRCSTHAKDWGKRKRVGVRGKEKETRRAREREQKKEKAG